MERRERKKYSVLLRARTMSIDEGAMQRYRKILLFRAIISFLMIFLIILERIFSDYTKPFENQVLNSLQSLFGVNDYSDDLAALSWLRFFHNFHYLNLILLHCYLVLFYWKNVLVALKVMIVHYNFLVLLANFEIFFGEPRPFWEYSSIVGIVCEASYAFPSYSVFSIAFLVLYANYCYSNDQDDDEEQTRFRAIIKWVLWGALVLVYCFLALLMGLNYLSQIVLVLFYSILIFFIVNFFEKAFNNLVVKSTFQVDTAKRYLIYWLIYAVITAAISTVIYTYSDTSLDIIWFKNLCVCLDTENDTSYNSKPYYHLLGPWPTLLKTSILFGLIGAIFGAAKVFRRYQGTAWFETTTRNRAIMTLIANLFVIPLWVLAVFRTPIMEFFALAGINNYLYYAIILMASYYFLFGFLPLTLFRWLNLLDLEADSLTIPFSPDGPGPNQSSSQGNSEGPFKDSSAPVNSQQKFGYDLNLTTE